MKSQLLLLLIVPKFLIFLFLSIPLSFSNIIDQFTTCATTTAQYRCGNIQGIIYPFWGENVPEYCGHHEFHLNCLGKSFPVIDIKEQRYSVLDINRDKYTISITPFSVLNPCSVGIFHPHNHTLDHPNFGYAETVTNIRLIYGCPLIPPFLRYEFICGGAISHNYYADEFIWERQKQNFKHCTANITFPVSEVAVQELLEDSMTLLEALNHGLDVEYFANRDACAHCENSLHGFCGSDPTTHKFFCNSLDNVSQLWNASSPGSRTGEEYLKLKLSIGIWAGVALVLSLCISAFSFWSIRRLTSSNQMAISCCQIRDNNDKNIEMWIKQYECVAPKRYSYSDIKRITNSFKIKLGEGGYGCVYKGKLLNGRLVAVKMLNKSKGIGEEFINEVASISRTCHVNIVSLIGFCFQGRKRALVYEFMPNGSLDKFLYNGNTSKECLGWIILYQIAIGIARGLEYLHRGCNTQILHFDIKPHNILLDEDFCPKISDFGLSKLCSRKKSTVTMEVARGTIGYIAPEVCSRTFGSVSHKSDVYSYGMMVLEMVSGRNNKNVREDHKNKKSIYFPHWIFNRVKLGDDLGLYSVMTKEDDEIARKLVFVGLWCVQTNPSHRPSMSEVLKMLEVSDKALAIPPQPFYFSPQNSDGDHSHISVSSK